MIYLDKNYKKKDFKTTPMEERYKVDDVIEKLHNNKDHTVVFDGKTRKNYQFKKKK